MLKDMEYKMIAGKLVLVRKQIKGPEEDKPKHSKNNVINIKFKKKDDSEFKKVIKKKKKEQYKVTWKWVNGKLVADTQANTTKNYNDKRGPLLDVPHAPCAKTRRVRFDKGKSLDQFEIDIPFTGKTFEKDSSKLNQGHDCKKHMPKQSKKK